MGWLAMVTLGACGPAPESSEHEITSEMAQEGLYSSYDSEDLRDRDHLGALITSESGRPASAADRESHQQQKWIDDRYELRDLAGLLDQDTGDTELE